MLVFFQQDLWHPSLLTLDFLAFNLKVIQQRGGNGGTNENFTRTWDEYKHGFGDYDKEFWLGNELIHQLTKYGDMKLMVELKANNGLRAWAQYDTFRWNLLIYDLILQIK